MTDNKGFYNTKEVLSLTTFSLSTLLRESASGRFPKAAKVARKKVAYAKADVDEWLKTKATSANLPL